MCVSVCECECVCEGGGGEDEKGGLESAPGNSLTGEQHDTVLVVCASSCACCDAAE